MESKLQALSLSQIDFMTIISKGEPWTDNAFPPTRESIWNA